MSRATRRSRQDRRQTVLAAAAARVRSARVDWASTLTFGRLAADTGIDQGQIARDFGSKDGLTVELARYLLDPETDRRRRQPTLSWAEDVVEQDGSLIDALHSWASGSHREHRDDHEFLRAQMMLWASTEPGSPEWERLAEVIRDLVDRYAPATRRVVERAAANGATRRHHLSPEELVLVMSAVVDGLMIRASVAPDLVAGDLTARVVTALYASLIGPDDVDPAAQLDGLRLGATDPDPI